MEWNYFQTVSNIIWFLDSWLTISAWLDLQYTERKMTKCIVKCSNALSIKLEHSNNHCPYTLLMFIKPLTNKSFILKLSTLRTLIYETCPSYQKVLKESAADFEGKIIPSEFTLFLQNFYKKYPEPLTWFFQDYFNVGRSKYQAHPCSCTFSAALNIIIF